MVNKDKQLLDIYKINTELKLDKKKVLKYSIIIYIISALVILLGSYILYVIGG